ncbi:MAG: hypothetical protein ACIALR_08175, partial [Blastopirellula sp. JB062]
GDDVLPESPKFFAEDRSLRTGVINIGGSLEPLATDPDMTINADEGHFGTPGMAIRFDRPVRNGPGDDVIFFEVQMFSNPLEGDGFHVSPLKFGPGLRSHTIQTYDLTLESPGAHQVHPFFHYNFDERPRSLHELQSFNCDSELVVPATKFHAIAVGIDLSDLGYPEGAYVEGLFFQDDLLDKHIVDPVYIAGLPDLSETDASSTP